MAKKSNPAEEAKILLHLYELRQEPCLRKARSFMASEFWPRNYEEFKGLFFDVGTERNAFARQALSFWDMACAFVLSGAISEEIFFQTNGEAWFLYVKFKNDLPQLRKEFINAELALNIEKVVTKSAKGKDRVKRMEAYIKVRAEKAAAAKAAS
jgi:hypothetical protein